MDATYWEELFSSFRTVLQQEGYTLPSVSLIAQQNNDPFRVLISTIISLRTKDGVTLAASQRLFSLADTPKAMVGLSRMEIEQAIYPAGFYKTKAKTIQQISSILLESYQGKVPNDQKALLSLPGVGIKTANLTLNLGFQVEAICVDCHVHQIANRLGWVATKTPEQTEQALKDIMPRSYWIPLNELLVRYGQVICTPISPFCSKCPQRDSCPKIGVKRSR